MNDQISVLLVDDQELIRLGFRLILEAESDIRVVGEAEDGERALVEARRLQPDVVLMDVRMPRLDGIAATRRLIAEAPGARVLVLTTFDLDEYAFGALEAGASGFVLKDVQREELVSAIRAVHRGDAVLAPRITRLVLQRLSPSPQPLRTSTDADPAASLTERERDVFLAMGRGLSNSEIASELYLGESTVKTHVGRILTKLGARDRVQAVIIAHRFGHVGFDDPEGG